MAKNPTPLGKKPAAPGHGGARKGAGAPKGSNSAAATRRSKAVANAIAEGKRFLEEHDGTELPKDATPLDVMMMAMRKAYKLGGSIAATPYAEKCAPYIHARIAQMELKNPEGQVFALSFKWAGEGE